jgi:HEPN domain-containing protein
MPHVAPIHSHGSGRPRAIFVRPPSTSARSRPWSTTRCSTASAVEKALKGLLTWHDVPFRKTHSLEELGRQVVALHGDLRPLADRASLLSEYAWKFRYPGEVDSPSIAEATEALALAREAHAAVLATLGERLF